MKTSLAIILFLFISVMGFSQNSENESDIDKLAGKWFLSHQTAKGGGMLFEKAKPNDFRWGDYITILANGELIVGHSARCGNDTKIFRNYGKWTYNSDSKKIETSIAVHKKGNVFGVKFISDSKIVLE